MYTDTRLLYFIAVLHVLTFSTIMCEIDVVLEKKELPPEDLEVRHLIYSTSGFLAGEDTPVWLASKSDNDPNVIYTKWDEKKAVKKAYDYYKSGKFDGFSPKARRSVDENTYNITNDWNSANEMFSTSSMSEVNEQLVEKREARETNELYHPTVLIVMDYDDSKWPSNTEETKKFVYKKILYALAFFNGIDLQLRYIKNPNVRLRIAGIVIGRNRAATPYIRENENLFGLDVSSAYLPMTKYWRKLGKTNADFPMGSYDIVATMTETNELNCFTFLISSQPRLTGFFQYVYGKASPGPPCVSSGTNIAGLLFVDDHSFSGIQIAVHEIGHIMGETKHDGDVDGCPSETGYVMSQTVDSLGRKWSACSLKHISDTLRHFGRCLKDPKEFHPPGNQIPAILPGKLMPASEQCKARGWVDGNVCWKDVTCDYLYCSNDGWESPCKNSGQPADGTTCKTGMMCLDGKCVSNMTIAT